MQLVLACLLSTLLFRIPCGQPHSEAHVPVILIVVSIVGCSRAGRGGLRRAGVVALRQRHCHGQLRLLVVLVVGEIVLKCGGWRRGDAAVAVEQNYAMYFRFSSEQKVFARVDAV